MGHDPLPGLARDFRDQLVVTAGGVRVSPGGLLPRAGRAYRGLMNRATTTLTTTALSTTTLAT
jgi:hypothetical protein